MPKAFPIEFRHDVVAGAHKGEAPLSQLARDFEISESCLHRSLQLADIDDDVRPAVTSDGSRRVLLVRSACSCQLPMTSEGAYETKTQTTRNCLTGTLIATW